MAATKTPAKKAPVAQHKYTVEPKAKKAPVKGKAPFGGPRMSHGSIGRTGPAAKKASGGIDLGKFAGEVSSNFGRGVKAVGEGLNKALPSRGASSTVPGAMKNAASNRAGLRKAGWGK